MKTNLPESHTQKGHYILTVLWIFVYISSRGPCEPNIFFYCRQFFRNFLKKKNLFDYGDVIATHSFFFSFFLHKHKLQNLKVKMTKRRLSCSGIYSTYNYYCYHFIFLFFLHKFSLLQIFFWFTVFIFISTAIVSWFIIK